MIGYIQGIFYNTKNYYEVKSSGFTMFWKHFKVNYTLSKSMKELKAYVHFYSLLIV